MMKRILIVDDDASVRLVLRKMLSSSGYHVAGEAETGRQAVEMAQDLHPDLVLMDIVMPGEMDGISAAEKIKQDSDIPIVFISGHGNPEYIERAKQSEPFGYLMKPFDQAEMRASIEIALYRSEMKRKTDQTNRQLKDLNLSLQQEIEDRKRAEEARLELEGQLHRAQKMAALGTLVAGVAHEINNPNNFISINAPMLNKAWESIIPILEDYYGHNGDFMVGGIPYTTMRERVPQLLAGVSDGSRRIKKIVSDLKHFARPDSAVSFEPLDINSAVKSSLTLVSNLLKKSTNHFKVEYGQDIPKIKGNLQHLEQVIINLVQNACQSLSDKDKEIRVSTTYREKAETILIEVRDQGVGIPAESLPRIMDPFFTTKRSSGGTGLGLSVSFSIIERHSGTLTAASEEGKGTTFTIALPVRGKKSRVKILVVDDDHMLRETIVESLLKNSMFSVEDSPNGIDACIKLGSFRPDLLILDIHMPDMNGVEVCKRIKGDPDFSHMKVIVITGFPGGDKAKEIAGMGFRYFCPKPVTMKDFEGMVRRVLNGY
jgi:signal transduction histidine kinase